ncbi:MAG: hypothetical protein AAGG51_15890 [Cyanobacteria bacterium P01_G01_bin.54]
MNKFRAVSSYLSVIPFTLLQGFSDEEMFRDWQRSLEDCNELKKYQKQFDCIW